jgi:hypothetical protein
VASHDAKAAALFAFFHGLLGRRVEVTWDFDVDQLYAGCSRVNADALVGPFSAQELEAAFFSLDRTSAPGPDGFGPAFYRAAWATARPTMARLFESFHSRAADLVRINRAHIVLLPKHGGVLTPGSFLPVSQQNCSIKAVCKGAHLPSPAADQQPHRRRPDGFPLRPEHL